MQHPETSHRQSCSSTSQSSPIARAKTLGYQTDLLVMSTATQFFTREGYTVVRSPNAPGFYWGNFLLLDKRPSLIDIPKWETTFRREFNDVPEVNHISIAWDCVDKDANEFDSLQRDGYVVENNTVMGLSPIKVNPCHVASDIHIRRITSNDDWHAIEELQTACREDRFSEIEYRKFISNRFKDYRELISKQCGAWFGAFVGPTLMADLGLFWTNNIGRFQMVETHPLHRRKGICGTLVSHCCNWAFESNCISTLIISADPDEQAYRVYKSLGFKEIEHHITSYN